MEQIKKKVVKSFALHAQCAYELENYCAQQGISQTDAIHQMIWSYLADNWDQEMRKPIQEQWKLLGYS